MRCSGSRTCSSSCSRTTGRRASPSPGTRGPCTARPSPRTTRPSGGRCRTCCASSSRYFRPIVEAFGYRNLEFEGWEADDVIATLATRADEAGIRTCVVSTDRDAFQLVSDNVCLMMTPRGVADVNVYTPERVEARLGVPPEKVPDLIGLKGDTSDNIPGIPGIGDKTAAQLIDRYGSLEDVLEHADELTPARAKAIAEHAEQARDSKLLATMRRDLDIDCDPAELVLRAPDRSQLREMFRRFEFRALLQRVDLLDEAVPAAELPAVEGEEVRWREGELSPFTGPVGFAADGERSAVATESEVVLGPRSLRVAADARGSRREVAARRGSRRHAHRRLPDRAGPGVVRARRPGRRVRRRGRARAAGRRGDGRARPSRRAAAAARSAHARAAAERGSVELYETVELPLTGVLAGDGGRGRQDRHLPDGRDHGAPPERVEELESRAYELAGEEFMLGSTQQVARILFEKLGLTPGRKGKTGYSTDTRVLRAIRGEHEIVPVLEEWRELTKLINTYLGPLPSLLGEDGRLHTTFNQTVAATGRLSTSNPNLQAIPIRTELGREIRSAFVAEPGCEARLRRLLAGRAAHPRPRLRRAEAARGVRARRGHPRGDRRRGARQAPGGADEGRAQRGQDGQLRDHLRHLRVRALREPRDPARGGADLHRRLPRPLPARAGLHRPHDRAGRTGRLRDDPARSSAPRSRDSRVRTGRPARSASGSPSTRSCRGRPPT